MKSTCIALVIAGILGVMPTLGFGQMTLEGVTLKQQQTRKGHVLYLNGGGVRTKLFFDLYVGGLYLETKTHDANRIIQADQSMMIQLTVISGLITSDKMVEATREGFEKATNGDTAPIQAEIEAFIDLFRPEIKEGDVFEVLYLPETGTQVFKNGQQVGSIAGLKFKQALFGIWLGHRPADDDLKEGLLGR